MPIPQTDERLSRVLDKTRRIEIRTRGLVSGLLAGAYQSRFRGRGTEFDELREYTAGDDVRAIDWNVTARTGTPHVKRFIEEREVTVMLLVDMSASGDFGSSGLSKRELAAEVAAVLAFAAETNRDKVGVALFTDRVERYLPPGKGSRHVMRVVQAILEHEPEGQGTDIAAALAFADRTLKRRAVVMLLSDLLQPDERGGAELDSTGALAEALRLTRGRHDLIALHMIDPVERRLPDIGRVALEDAETGELYLVDSGDPSVRRRYADLARARLESIARACRDAAVDRLVIDDAATWATELTHFFQRRPRA